MMRNGTPNLPPYDLRLWNNHELGVARHALDAEFERLQGLPAFREAHGRQREAAAPPTPYDDEMMRLHLASQLEERAGRIGERLYTAILRQGNHTERLRAFNDPSITDVERAFLVSFVGVAEAIDTRNDQQLYKAFDRRRFCMDVLRMANSGDLTIAYATNIQDGVDNGYIPRVLKPWILVDLEDRFERGDKTLEIIEGE